MPESFADLLARTTRTALKLEFRDEYMTQDPGHVAWQAGDLDAAVRAYADWTETAREATSRGVEVKRARVVSEPCSEYIKFEHAVTQRVNIDAGEQIRWVPRQRVSAIALPGNDVWVLDGETLQFYFFAGDGHYMGDEITTDPDTVKLCSTAFEAVWELGIDHNEYLASGAAVG
ncbi:hypothetical protein PWY87_22555 [Kribbella solani]|uniref:DUF6879 family protein n=1 Tax=Kribbella solani TaxID=236067 RepID=UPI0029A8CF4B|nr:DUF6879 family protein [Kribbella solani]MDX3004487.1 hypothetical protein [Kribbella solani]